LVDTVFEELVSDKSFIETCNFLCSHVIRIDQQYKEKAARQIHNTSQLSNRAKKDKVKKVLALINEIQIQDSCSSDEDSVTRQRIGRFSNLLMVIFQIDLDQP
jgi:hypothetical protein